MSVTRASRAHRGGHRRQPTRLEPEVLERLAPLGRDARARGIGVGADEGERAERLAQLDPVADLVAVLLRVPGQHGHLARRGGATALEVEVRARVGLRHQHHLAEGARGEHPAGLQLGGGRVLVPRQDELVRACRRAGRRGRRRRCSAGPAHVRPVRTLRSSSRRVTAYALPTAAAKDGPSTAEPSATTSRSRVPSESRERDRRPSSATRITSSPPHAAGPGGWRGRGRGRSTRW